MNESEKQFAFTRSASITSGRAKSNFLLVLLFFFSGFAALIYELLWFRQLGFIFGNTVFAATTVVTAYMAGLALGARFVGRRADRIKNPVRCFALFELGIGMWALVMPLLFDVIREIYRLAYIHVTGQFAALTVLRFILAFIALLAPTSLMGGTLPLLTEGFVRRDENFGRMISRLYGINTLGAVTGIAMAGFVLMPALGMTWSSRVGIASNFLVALAGLALARKTFAAPRPAEAPASSGHIPRRLILLACLSGFVALALEIVWFRALVLVFGSTTYSFTAMLAVFLFGIAAGSLLLGRFAGRIKNPASWFALFQIAIGLGTLGALYLYPAQPEFLLSQFIRFGLTWRVMTVAQIMIALKCLFIPTLLMGMSFPLLVIWCRQGDSRAALSVGRIYAANTIGCVLGSLAGGFLLLPAIGIERSLTVLMWASMVVGLFALLPHPPRTFTSVAAVAAVLCGGALMIFCPPFWDPKLLSAGPYFLPWLNLRGGHSILKDRLKNLELVYYHEGITATVSVSKTLDQTLYYSSGGKVEADSSPRSMMLQRLAGHLPMLFHPDPKSVLNIGLGAGVSFGALGCYPLDRLEVVEIEPGAVSVAGIFGPYNHHITDRSDAIITITDGRNHLFCSTNTYDVITSDPFEPVHAGANHLYTREHFAQARARLRPGGIMSQYVPLYELDPADYLAILRSFVSVFPETVLFYTGDDTILLGFRDRVALDSQTVRRRFAIPAAHASLAELGFNSPETILGMVVADLGKSGGFIGRGELNTDDHPVVEYAAPKSALTFTTFATCGVLNDHFTSLPAHFLEGLDDDARRALQSEHDGLKLSLESNIARSKNDTGAAYDLCMKAWRLAPGNPVIKNELTSMIMPDAEKLLASRRLPEAAEQFQRVLTLRDHEFWALYHLVSLTMTSGNTQLAGQYLQTLKTFYPQSGLVWMHVGKYEFMRGNKDDAMTACQKAVKLLPWLPGVWDDFARIAALCNRPDEALSAAKEAARLHELRGEKPAAKEKG